MRKLNEDQSEYLTEQEWNDVYNTCIKKLESLGPEFKIDWNEITYAGSFPGNNKFGECALNRTTFKMYVRFNKHLYKRVLKDLLINTIYHEFCHYYQNRDTIKLNIFNRLDNTEGDGTLINPETPEDIVLYYIGTADEGHHSPLWHKYADKVNAQLKPAIPVSAFIPNDVHNLFISSNLEEVIFEINCKNCDYSNKFIDFEPDELPDWFIEFITALYISSKNHEDNNLCKKCHGSLYINIKDPGFESFLQQLSIQIALQYLMSSTELHEA